MCDTSDDFEARIEPTSTNSWYIKVVEVYEANGNTKVLRSADTLYRDYDVDTIKLASSLPRAERKAKRMLARLRKAVAYSKREGMVVR